MISTTGATGGLAQPVGVNVLVRVRETFCQEVAVRVLMAGTQVDGFVTTTSPARPLPRYFNDTELNVMSTGKGPNKLKVRLTFPTLALIPPLTGLLAVRVCTPTSALKPEGRRTTPMRWAAPAFESA